MSLESPAFCVVTSGLRFSRRGGLLAESNQAEKATFVAAEIRNGRRCGGKLMLAAAVLADAKIFDLNFFAVIRVIPALLEVI